MRRGRRIPYTDVLSPMAAYCEVALPVPLDHTFTYAVREGQPPQRGARVIAPFRNEKLIGVVTAVERRLRRRSRCVIWRPCWMRSRCSASSLLELAEWMAQYYLAPLGEVLRAMLPLTAEVRRTVYYRITDLGRDVLAKAVEGDGAVRQLCRRREAERRKILRFALRFTKVSLRMTFRS